MLRPIRSNETALSERALRLVVLALIAYRVAYHSTYLGEVPFAMAPISDGRVYEDAALDILSAPPWGTRPFYLQGLYAYFMALAMSVWAWPHLALVLQLLLAAAAFFAAHAALRRSFGARAALLGTALLLASPGIAFYENKYLSASLTVSCEMLALHGFARFLEARTVRWALVLGVTAGLLMLARPNYVLYAPFLGVGVLTVLRDGRARRHTLAAVAVGVVCTVSPMALRNLVVTGAPDLFPVHGGGTSFYIGNNPEAHGGWNAAGGLISGDVRREQLELVGHLGLEVAPERDQARAIGAHLYRRALDFIVDDPWAWGRLEWRKWVRFTGNDELTHDFDVWGEQALIPFAHRVGVPFGVMLGLGLAGVVLLLSRARQDDEVRAWGWVLGGLLVPTVLVNLAFFSTAQHRLPAQVPLAFAAALFLDEAWRRVATRVGAHDRAFRVGAVVALLVSLQALIPRTTRRVPTPMHHYNLALAYDYVGELPLAKASLDRALDARPGEPIFLLERARLRRRTGDFAGAAEDLGARLLPGTPAWLMKELELERRMLALERARLSETRTGSSR